MNHIYSIVRKDGLNIWTNEEGEAEKLEEGEENILRPQNFNIIDT
jgi:hypothetical protein